jgi:hypothetical protein
MDASKHDESFSVPYAPCTARIGIKNDTSILLHSRRARCIAFVSAACISRIVTYEIKHHV